MVRVRVFYNAFNNDHKDLELSRMPCVGERILIEGDLLEVESVTHWAEVDTDGIVGDVQTFPIEPR
jgi:hypothetical protein